MNGVEVVIFDPLLSRGLAVLTDHDDDKYSCVCIKSRKKRQCSDPTSALFPVPPPHPRGDSNEYINHTFSI